MVESMPQLLEAHPLFSGLPAEAIGTVVRCAKAATFDQGALLTGAGTDTGTLYLLRRGVVAVEVHAPGRGGLVVQTLGPGQVVGWSGVVPPIRWAFDVRAVTPVGALAVDGHCLRQRADAQPEVGYWLQRRISTMLLDQLHATLIQLLDLYGHDLP